MLDDNINFSYDNVLAYMDGVLWYEGKPLYIVRVTMKNHVRTAYVYNISVQDYKKYKVVRKDWQKVDRSRSRLVDPNSPIGASYNQKVEPDIVNIEKPYLFSAPVVAFTSSISGKEGDGFFERIKNPRATGSRDALVKSGVFIGMDDITWESDKLLYNKESLVKEVLRSSRDEMMAKIDNPDREVYF